MCQCQFNIWKHNNKPYFQILQGGLENVTWSWRTFILMDLHTCLERSKKRKFITCWTAPWWNFITCLHRLLFLPNLVWSWSWTEILQPYHNMGQGLIIENFTYLHLIGSYIRLGTFDWLKMVSIIYFMLDKQFTKKILLTWTKNLSDKKLVRLKTLEKNDSDRKLLGQKSKLHFSPCRVLPE